jgi:serine/threonine protein kinase
MLPDNSAIGRYEILRRVAHGGMGTLYLAHDPVLGRPVAVKLFLGDLDLPDARDRFVREARAAAALNHPNIVTIYDYGEFSSQPYMVMEFIQGATLADLIRRRADLAILTKLRWMEELCSAVEYAHAHGVIHRDLKPLNLMVDTYDRLKVLDFGIARMRGSLASRATARIGTAGYMAPEQIRGGNIDHRSDLFSIGVVCYELITYVEPFAADVDVAITNRILEEDPRPLQELNPNIDPQLADLVWKALRKDPAQRFQDAESMRKALSGVRRQLEASSDSVMMPRPPLSDVPTPAVVPGAEPRPQGSEATGPVSGPTDKRTERDALVKKRTAQIRTSLELARQSLQIGRPSEARVQCEAVLNLDSAQPEALDLLRRIDVEIAGVEAVDLLTRGQAELERGALTKAVELLDRARGLAPDNPEAGRLDRAVRLARAQQDVERRRAERFRLAVQAAEDALDRGGADEALGHVREALEIDPASERARALEGEALRRIDEVTGQTADSERAPAARPTGPSDPTILSAPPPRRSGPLPPPAEAKIPGPDSVRPTPPAPPKLAKLPKPPKPPQPPSKLSVLVATLPSRWRRMSSRQRKLIVSGTASVAVLAVVAIVFAATGPGGGPPPAVVPVVASAPVSVVIDAVPWAEVKKIVRDGGEEVPLKESPSYTPLRIDLAPGGYRFMLEGPQGASQPRDIPYEVKTDALPLPLERFEPMTAEKYFQPYLNPKAPAPVAKEVIK